MPAAPQTPRKEACVIGNRENEMALPQHVGIIMDGNGRWAKKRGLSRNIGHRQGANTFGDIVRHANKRGIGYLTVYAFSTENWSRPPEEVRAIMDLMRSYLKDIRKYEKENVRILILGERAQLDEDIRQLIDNAQRASASCTGLTLNIAINYGGRDEIVHAARTLAGLCAQGKLNPASIDEALFARHLYTAGQPDVDLIIRTSGEMRVSNFLPWQGAYAEYVFSDTLWPDFSSRDFDAALKQYAARERRMGGI